MQTVAAKVGQRGRVGRHPGRAEAVGPCVRRVSDVLACGALVQLMVVEIAMTPGTRRKRSHRL
eukprot:835735-Prymnesium_polylepis.1